MQTKKMILTALCISFGILLPIFLHSVPNAGSVLLPMHIPVLLCGLACGPFFGLFCGIATPLLSSLLTGMPPAAYLPSMVCELAVYGLLSGLFLKNIKTKRPFTNVFISLLLAMIGGRICYGILNALIFNVGEYSLAIWATGMFVNALPGIIIQLILIPMLIFALKKSGVIKYELSANQNY